MRKGPRRKVELKEVTERSSRKGGVTVRLDTRQASINT
jgi:hypothetical protein